MKFSTLMIGLVAASFAVSGCSGVKNSMQKLTGQRKDTVLPGEREEVLPRSQTSARNPEYNKKGTTAQVPEQDVSANDGTAPSRDLAAPCDPEIQICDEPADGGVQDPGGGVFADPQ